MDIINEWHFKPKSGAKIVLEDPDKLFIKQSLKFEFKSTNNQDEHKALITSMNLAIEMGASCLRVRSDSQLIAN